MGRASQRKRTRRDPALTALQNTLSAFSSESLLSLLTAACSSPGGLHRLPSLSVVLGMVIRSCPSGRRLAGPNDLAHLVDLAVRARPELETYEDWIPGDPRARVKIAHRGRRFALHPGDRERIVGDLRNCQFVASVVDPVLERTIGFGISDLMEICLAQVASAVECMTPAWDRDGARPARGEDIIVMPTEVVAARAISSHDLHLAGCRFPHRSLSALDWATSPSSSLPCEPADPNSTFGRYVATHTRDHGRWPLPPALQLGSLCVAAADLAVQALAIDPTLGAAFRSRVKIRIAELLQSLNHQVIHPVDATRVGPPWLLIVCGRRHVVAIRVVTSLDSRMLERALASESQMALPWAPGSRVRTSAGTFEVPGDVEFLPLVVAAGAAHLSVRLGVPAVSLDGLEWIAATMEASEDFWMYVQSLTGLATSRHLVFDDVDIWETWRTGAKGVLVGGGIDPDFILFAPHGGLAEWERSAELEPFEEVLEAAGQPEVHAWDRVHRSGNSLRLTKQQPLQAWLLSAGPVRIAFEMSGGHPPANLLEHLDNLCSTFVSVLDHFSALEQLVEAAFGSPTMVVRFLCRSSPTDEPPLTADISTTERVIVLRWDESLLTKEMDTPGLAQQLLGESLSRGFANLCPPASEDLLSRFAADWATLPLFFTATTTNVSQRVMPKAPIRLNAAARASVRRTIEQHLATRGGVVGAHGRTQATERLTEIAQITKGLFLGALSTYKADDLVERATAELEAAAADRFVRQVQWRDSLRRGVHLPRATPSVSETQEETSRLCRTIAAIIEQATAAPPSGRRRPDDLDWLALLAVTDEYLYWATTSEANHQDVQRAIVEINDQFEITTKADEDIAIDMAGFNAARALDWVRGMAPTREASTAPEPDASASLLDIWPQLDLIDTALKRTNGFGVNTVNLVLEVAANFDVGTTGSAIITRARLITECSLVGDASKTELAAAIDSLILSQSELNDGEIEPWESRRRRYRLLTMPLLSRETDKITILPWWCGISREVWLRYLQIGSIPWPAASRGADLQRAIDRTRERRNRELEASVGDALRALGWRVKDRVKKAATVGLPSLPGEIDAIALDEATATIWVVEVKDPDEIFGMAEIRNQLLDFHHPTRGYVKKLIAKAAAVDGHCEAVAQALGGPIDRPWRARPLMVTRRIEPAAFVPGATTEFITLDGLRARSATRTN
jgi:hypothetical protein